MHLRGMGSPWVSTFATYGWVTCPLASFPGSEESVRDNPASEAAFDSKLALGIPHPLYGVMRATVVLTPSTSLARLSLAAQDHAKDHFSWSADLPLLFVGSKPFVDCVGDSECTVMGILVYSGNGFRVEFAPLTLAHWHGMWLPFFEDSGNWVMTGWDTAGRVTRICKPFGWGCELLGSRGEGCSSCESRA